MKTQKVRFLLINWFVSSRFSFKLEMTFSIF